MERPIEITSSPLCPAIKPLRVNIAFEIKVDDHYPYRTAWVINLNDPDRVTFHYLHTIIKQQAIEYVKDKVGRQLRAPRQWIRKYGATRDQSQFDIRVNNNNRYTN
jgi:hypothetical protein